MQLAQFKLVTMKISIIVLLISITLLNCNKNEHENKDFYIDNIHDQFMGAYNFTIWKSRTEDHSMVYNFSDKYSASGNISKFNEKKISLDYMPDSFLPPDSIWLYERTPDTLLLSIFDEKILSYPEYVEQNNERGFSGGFVDNDSIIIHYGVWGADYSYSTRIAGKKIE